MPWWGGDVWVGVNLRPSTPFCRRLSFFCPPPTPARTTASRAALARHPSTAPGASTTAQRPNTNPRPPAPRSTPPPTAHPTNRTAPPSKTKHWPLPSQPTVAHAARLPHSAQHPNQNLSQPLKRPAQVAHPKHDPNTPLYNHAPTVRDGSGVYAYHVRAKCTTPPTRRYHPLAWHSTATDLTST